MLHLVNFDGMYATPVCEVQMWTAGLNLLSAILSATALHECVD